MKIFILILLLPGVVFAQTLTPVRLKAGDMATQTLQCYSDQDWKKLDAAQSVGVKKAVEVEKCLQDLKKAKVEIVNLQPDPIKAKKFYEKKWFLIPAGFVLVGFGVAIGRTF